MLGDEDGMAFHRGLAAVVRNDSGGKPCGNQFFSVPCDGADAFFMDVPDLLCLEMPTHAELGMGERQQPFSNPASFIREDSWVSTVCRNRRLGDGICPEIRLAGIGCQAVWIAVSGRGHISICQGFQVLRVLGTVRRGISRV